MKSSIKIILVCSIYFLIQGVDANDLNKKFIHLGWDIPNTAYLRQHWQDMEANTPFDGVMFYVDAKSDNNKRASSQAVWDTNKWEFSWFTNVINDLKQCKFKKFTDNFIRFNATPGNIDWSDDVGWKILFQKARICSKIAKECGVKGLAPDFESYGEPQFKFNPESKRTFDETKSLVRKRGREFIQAISSEQPEAVILSLWLNSINFRAGASENPDYILIGDGYGLLPMFINGMLDALPTSMILVDGCESGYYMDSYQEYLQAANRMRSWSGPAVRLVSPENRQKYIAQVQAGFGFYLDMYLNEEGNRYYFPPLDGSRLKRLHRNLSAALNAADEYVWIYGEQCRWWQEPVNDKWFKNLSKTVGKGRLWDEAIPKITDVITYVKNPTEYVQNELKKNSLTNLAINGNFAMADEKSHLPSGFSVWQDEKLPRGEFLFDQTIGNGSARAKMVKRGCLIQKHKAIPGERYYVSSMSLSKGNSVPTIMIRWQDTNEKWVHWNDDKIIAFQKPTSDWQQTGGVVEVPENTAYLVILLNVASQNNEQDVCWFDNLVLFKLPALFE